MASMTTVKCTCGTEFQARTADVKRGWGMFCSKSCKAKKQTKDTGISGPHYKASGRTVNQMKNGKFAKSRFSGGNKLPDSITKDRCGSPKECFCGATATYFVQSGFGHNGWEGMCEDHIDDAHPFDSDNFNNT